MNHVSLVRDQSICTRKERRYKTNDDNLLRCETALEEGGLRHGRVLDLSSTGLRMVCEGKFSAGAAFTVQLTTDRSHGMYRGVVRRVDPWVGGKTVIGCSLNDTIPDSVLEELARQEVVDRRSDERIEIVRQVKISWQLQAGEIDGELRDCSYGGMKLQTKTAVPMDSRLRIRVQDVDGQWIVVEGNSVWQRQQEDESYVGVAFTQKDAPGLISPLLNQKSETAPTSAPFTGPRMRPVSYAACAVIVAYTILMFC